MLRSKRLVAVGLAATILLSTDAHAWDETTKRAITQTAIKLIRQHYNFVFKTESRDYVADVVQGAKAAADVFRDSEQLTEPTTVMGRIGEELQVLRHMRDNSTPAYFAYRMGALAGLVSDLVMPLGLDQSGRYTAIREAVESDVAKHLGEYSYESRRGPLLTIREPRDYYPQYRQFHQDAQTLILSDYRTGRGYSGYMKQAGPKYFQDSINAVLDTWNTVLQRRTNVHDREPSAEAQTWYRVGEIAYQLNEKNDLHMANQAYTRFSTVNPGIQEASEAVGDLFYAYGDKQQGVREWEFALQFPGDSRRDIVQKLAEHFMGVGRSALEKANEDAEVRDTEYDRALRAFEQALQFKRNSNEAAQMITQTNQLITDREKQRKVMIDIMSAAEKTIGEAEQAFRNENYQGAIDAYEQAIGMLEAVTEDFPDQHEIAEDLSNQSSTEIRSIVSTLLQRARIAIADANNAKDQRKWDEAEQLYNNVEFLLRPIEAEEGVHAREKRDLIEKAEDLLSQLEIERKRWEQQQQQQGGGGGPAAG